MSAPYNPQIDFDLIYEVIRPFAEALNEIGVVNQVFGVLNLSAIGVAVLIYFIQRKERIPCFATRAISFPPANIDLKEFAVPLSVGGRSVDVIHLTRLVFLNRGREPIRRLDLAQSDPLRWVWSGRGELLGFRVAGVSRTGCGVSPHLGDDGDLKLDFDHLNKGDFFSIEVLHTYSDSLHGEIAGSIVGVKRIENYDERIYRRADALFLFVGISFLLSIVTMIWNAFSPQYIRTASTEIAAFFSFAIVPMTMILAGVLYELSMPRCFRFELSLHR